MLLLVSVVKTLMQPVLLEGMDPQLDKIVAAQHEVVAQLGLSSEFALVTGDNPVAVAIKGFTKAELVIYLPYRVLQDLENGSVITTSVKGRPARLVAMQEGDREFGDVLIGAVAA